MANPNANKQVGEPCAKCNTPLIEGKNGAYCKPCYIAYAEGKKSGGSKPAQSGGNGKKSDQDLKSIVVSYAKDVVVALIGAGHIKKSETAIANIKGIAVGLYDWVTGADKVNQTPVIDDGTDDPVFD